MLAAKNTCARLSRFFNTPYATIIALTIPHSITTHAPTAGIYQHHRQHHWPIGMGVDNSAATNSAALRTRILLLPYGVGENE